MDKKIKRKKEKKKSNLEKKPSFTSYVSEPGECEQRGEDARSGRKYKKKDSHRRRSSSMPGTDRFAVIKRSTSHAQCAAVVSVTIPQVPLSERRRSVSSQDVRVEAEKIPSPDNPAVAGSPNGGAESSNDAAGSPNGPDDAAGSCSCGLATCSSCQAYDNVPGHSDPDRLSAVSDAVYDACDPSSSSTKCSPPSRLPVRDASPAKPVPPLPPPPQSPTKKRNVMSRIVSLPGQSYDDVVVVADAKPVIETIQESTPPKRMAESTPPKRVAEAYDDVFVPASGGPAVLMERQDSGAWVETPLPADTSAFTLPPPPEDEGGSSDGMSSDSEEGLLDDPDPGDVAPEPEQSTSEKLRKVATELLDTERKYVTKLHVVWEFYMSLVIRNQRDNLLPVEEIDKMFLNIKAIHELHRDNFLPALEKRIEQWEVNSKLGDLLKRYSPFFKIYTDFYQNFDSAMNHLQMWQQKSAALAEMVKGLNEKEEMGKLSLEHLMLEPVQRVPRYELLLKQYLKHLPPESDDFQPVAEALNNVTTAASKSNNAMKKLSNFRRMLEIKDSTNGLDFELISPHRDIIKEGHIKKLSAKNGEVQDRYLFVFTDVLLLCSEKASLVGHTYNLHSWMDVEGMQPLEGSNISSRADNTFRVKTKQKVVDFAASNCEEKTEWLQALWEAVKEVTRRNMSRNVGDDANITDAEVGKRAPLWQRDQDAPTCMSCSRSFTFSRRRHHCRACGRVLCSKCSAEKCPLDFMASAKLYRVCKKCSNILQERARDSADGLMESVEFGQVPGLANKQQTSKEVRATDASVVFGYLWLKEGKRAVWVRRFFSLSHDSQLHSFASEGEASPLTSLVLRDYSVRGVGEGEVERDHAMCLDYASGKKSKRIFLSAETSQQLERWQAAVEAACRGDMEHGS